jgi:hypothetical protein
MSSGVLNLISGCVIWPIFCASVMPATICLMRASIALSCLTALVMCGQSVSGFGWRGEALRQSQGGGQYGAAQDVVMRIHSVSPLYIFWPRTKALYHSPLCLTMRRCVA